MDTSFHFAPLRAIVFDMDGTLYRSTALDQRYQESIYAFLSVSKGWSLSFARTSFETKYCELTQRFRRTPSKLYTLAQFGVSDQEWAERQGGQVVTSFKLKPNPRLRKTLLQLRLQFRLGLVTNNHHNNTQETLAQLNVSDCFDEVMTLTESGIFKPSPELYRRMAGRLGVAPAECLSVGDRYDLDLEPAARIGMQTLWVRRLDDIYRLPQALRPVMAKAVTLGTPAQKSASARRTVQELRRGHLAVLPTDTVYGVASIPDPQAVRWIYRAKGRDENQPLVLLIDDPAQADRYARVSGRARELMSAHWPGALTLVLPVRSKTAWAPITRGRSTIGLRVPQHPWLCGVIRRCGGAMVTTSANRSGEPAATEIQEVDPALLAFCHLLVDGGKTTVGVNSTVAQVMSRRVCILRQGSVHL